MDKIEQTLNSIDKANESVEDAKYEVEQTMYAVNSKVISLEEQVEQEYMNDEYFQEALLTGTLIGGGILALIGGIVAAVKKFIGKSSSGDKSESTTQEAAAGNQSAVVKMTGVNEADIEKHIKALEEALNSDASIKDIDVPGTFVKAEGDKVIKAIEGVYTGLEEIVKLYKTFAEASDENAQITALNAIIAKVKDISGLIKTDLSALKNSAAVKAPQAIETIKEAYEFKKAYSNQKKLDEITKAINESKSAKANTSAENGEENKSNTNIDDLRKQTEKAVAALQTNFGGFLTKLVEATNKIISDSASVITSAAQKIKQQKQQQQKQQPPTNDDEDEYPMLTKYGITPAQVLEDINKYGGVDPAFMQIADHAKKVNRKIEEGDLVGLVNDYNDIASKNNIKLVPMRSVDAYKQDPIFMRNVVSSTEIEKPEQQNEQPTAKTPVIDPSMIDNIYADIYNNLSTDGIALLQQLVDSYNVDEKSSFITNITHTYGSEKGLTSGIKTLKLFTNKKFTDAISTDVNAKTNFDKICNGIINNYLNPLFTFFDSMGVGIGVAGISQEKYIPIKKEYENIVKLINDASENASPTPGQPKKKKQTGDQIPFPDFGTIFKEIEDIIKNVQYYPNPQINNSIIKWTGLLDNSNETVNVSDLTELSKDILTNTKMFIAATKNKILNDKDIEQSLIGFGNKVEEIYNAALTKVTDQNDINAIKSNIEDLKNVTAGKQIASMGNEKQERIDKLNATYGFGKDHYNLLAANMRAAGTVDDFLRGPFKNGFPPNYLPSLATISRYIPYLTEIANIENIPTGTIEAPQVYYNIISSSVKKQPTKKTKADVIAKYSPMGFTEDMYDSYLEDIKNAGSVDAYLSSEAFKNNVGPSVTLDDIENKWIPCFSDIAEVEGLELGALKSAQEYFDMITKTTPNPDPDKEQKITEFCNNMGMSRKSYDNWANYISNYSSFDECFTNLILNEMQPAAKQKFLDENYMSDFLKIIIGIAEIEGLDIKDAKSAKDYVDMLSKTITTTTPEEQAKEFISKKFKSFINDVSIRTMICKNVYGATTLGNIRKLSNIDVDEHADTFVSYHVNQKDLDVAIKANDNVLLDEFIKILKGETLKPLSKDDRINQLIAHYSINQTDYASFVKEITNEGSLEAFLEQYATWQITDAFTERDFENKIKMFEELVAIEGLERGNPKDAKYYFDISQREYQTRLFGIIKKSLTDGTYTVAGLDISKDDEVDNLINHMYNNKFGKNLNKMDNFFNSSKPEDIQKMLDESYAEISSTPKDTPITDINDPRLEEKLKQYNNDDAFIKKLFEIFNEIDGSYHAKMLNSLSDPNMCEPIMKLWGSFANENDVTAYDTLLSEFKDVNSKTYVDLVSIDLVAKNMGQPIFKTIDEVAKAYADKYANPTPPEITPEKMAKIKTLIGGKLSDDEISKLCSKSFDELRKEIFDAFTNPDYAIGFAVVDNFDNLRTVCEVLYPDEYKKINSIIEDIGKVQVLNNGAMQAMRMKNMGEQHAYLLSIFNLNENEFIERINNAANSDEIIVLKAVAAIKGYMNIGSENQDVVKAINNASIATKTNELKNRLMNLNRNIDTNLVLSDNDIKTGIASAIKFQETNSGEYENFSHVIQAILVNKYAADLANGKKPNMIAMYKSKSPFADTTVKNFRNRIEGSNVEPYVYAILTANQKLFSRYTREDSFKVDSSTGKIPVTNFFIEEAVPEDVLEFYLNNKTHVFLDKNFEKVSNGSPEIYYEGYEYINGYIEMI